MYDGTHIARALFKTDNISTRIFKLTPFDDLLALVSSSKSLRSSFHALVSVRAVQIVEDCLDCNTEDLQDLLLNTYGILTGLVCLEILGITQMNKSIDTELLLLQNKGNIVDAFLKGKGFQRQGYNNSDSTSRLTIYEHWWLPNVCVTAVQPAKFWLPFLQFHGSMSAVFMSATQVFTLYPELMFKCLNLMRHTSLHLASEHDIYHQRASALGFDSFRHNGFLEITDVLLTCPGLMRNLRGGKGVVAIPWANLPSRCAEYEDFYRSGFRRGFSDNLFVCRWQFATWCSDVDCKFRRLMNVPGLDGV
ncbi:hypothetical protein PM082_002100 [Marasmius tenuissimus]|nr:hypothetical protein PM082_002100 [Marasmius tenuissimus]